MAVSTAASGFWVRTPILGLFLGGCPTAVVGSVPLCVVDPVERLPLGARAHIVNKVLELQPTLANGYSSGAVVCETSGIRVRASIDHGSPSGHLWGHQPIRVSAVSGEFGRDLSPLKTPATGGSAGPEHTELVTLLTPAVTNAPPNGASLGGSYMDFDGDQGAESIPCDVNSFRHRPNYNGEWQ